ncbi:MAG: spore germination protein [Clostridia bacterium]|nr:spore germination protein [Clostridia bacterium]
MSNNITFGRWEAVAILVNLIITQIVLGFPRSMVETAGTAGWMVPVYVTAIALISFAIISKLYSRFEGKDLIDIAEETGGNILRIIIGLIFASYIAFAITVVLREFCEDMKIVALPVSPISFVTLFFVTGMIAAAYLGIEPIVRFSSIIIPVIIGGLLIILIGVAPAFDILNLTPVLGTGPVDIFGKGFLKLSIFSAVSLIFFIAPFIKTKKNFRSVGYITIIISGILFLITTVVYILVYPFPIGVERFLPIYQLARLINYGRFFQRIESVFVLIWATSAFIYLGMGFFLILHILRKTFKLEYYKPLIIPMAILVFTCSLLPPNLMTALELEHAYFRNYIWIVTFAIPILLLYSAGLVKKSRKRKEAGK